MQGDGPAIGGLPVPNVTGVIEQSVYLKKGNLPSLGARNVFCPLSLWRPFCGSKERSVHMEALRLSLEFWHGCFLWHLSLESLSVSEYASDHNGCASFLLLAKM
jgi:hypothetical protein